MAIKVTTPITEEVVKSLRLGDVVLLDGVIVTARDMALRWLFNKFVVGGEEISKNDLGIYKSIKPILVNGIIFHCGPIVKKIEKGKFKVIAAGPTTSSRSEPYMGKIIRHFKLKGVIGKGGMGQKTLDACCEAPSVYFHAIGGAAALIAETVRDVTGVYKLEFGIPEAMWVFEVREFPLIVTMDSHGNSLHRTIEHISAQRLQYILDEPAK
jgi:fumarate hydratase class I